MKSSRKSEVWNHPLIFWLCDCASGDAPLLAEHEWRAEQRYGLGIEYEELLDGYLMSSLMRYIDDTANQGHPSEARGAAPKCSKATYQELLSRICRFYETNLEPHFILNLPDVQLLSEPNEDQQSSFEELKKAILLILGCAIHSEKRKVFVNRITGFEEHLQVGLAKYIQQLTEPTEHTKMKDEQREETESISSGGGNEQKLQSQENLFNSARSGSPNSEHRSLTLRLANVNHENRQLRTQAENKDEECRKLEVELEEKGRRISILENERLRLLEKEKDVKKLNDDLQAARCRIEQLQPMEGYKKKFEEAKEEQGFFKSKYEIVNKKNEELEATINLLEQNVTTLQIENQDKSSVEETLLRMKNTVRSFEADIGKKNSEIETLLDEKHRLNYELREREERIFQLETCSTTTTPRYIDTLADQLEDAKKDEFEIMKAEIRKLRAQTEGAIPETSFQQASEEIEELRKKLSSEELKNAELSLSIQKMQVEREHIDGNIERVGIELEGTALQLEHVRQERDEAVKSLHEARRKFSQFQAEFGKRLEEDSQNSIRSLRYELEEVTGKLSISQDMHTELEHQIGRLKEENRRALFELDEVREEKSQVEQSRSQTERSRKSVEAERDAMKRKIEGLEDDVENFKMQLIGSESTKKKLDDKDSMIGRLHDEKGVLENELKTIQHQMSVELKKTQRLREDLVSEKSKRADLVGRLRSLCTTLSLNGGNVDVEELDDEKLINSIDDIMMNALVAVKRESDSLRIQQNKQIAELSDLKRDIEKLRRCESESLNESDDRVRELTKENIHTKEQVYLLQEKLRELNLELSTRCNEIEIAKSSIEELNRSSAANSANNTEVARLQVSIRNSQIQEDLVKQENTALKEELASAQKQSMKNAHNLEELEAMHKALLSDHSRLQHLHNLLTRDYDEAKKETLETKQKLHEVPRQHAFMNSRLHELEGKLASEIEQKEQQFRMFLELKKEHSLCFANMERLRHDFNDVTCVKEKLKMELCRVNDQILKGSDIIDELNKQLVHRTSEVGKLNSKLEALSQLNRTYAEENKNLSRQLEILLNQNKELLQRALHDKDQYHLEMKDYNEKINALRRHKEQLEDKIMDQYRTMDNKKTPERKQPLVKRAAKALINRRRAASNGGSTTEDSSAYSADERASPPLADDNDNLPPTCSSSDDHERTSPITPVTPITEFRSRNEHLGGSVRVSNFHSPRRSLGQNGLDPQNNSCSPYLPPRTPLRNTLATSSLRSRPPPPPYTPPQRSPFEPTAHSTPKRCLGNESTDRHVVGEGEKRDSSRDKEERYGKTLSYYENVNNVPPLVKVEPETKTSDSTMWYEYGCV